MNIKRIAFVCTGNTCRSPMAEGIAKKIFSDKNIDIISRGMSVFMPSGASRNACEAVKKYDADISRHISKQISEDDLAASDLIFTMTNTHKTMLIEEFPKYSHKIFTIYEFACEDCNQDVADPYGGSMEIYQKCCDEIYNLLKKISNKI